MTASTVSRRLRLGWSAEEAIGDTPAVPGCRDHAFRFVEAFGETKRFVDWVGDPRCKIGYGGLWQRLDKGWSAEDAIATPRGRTRSAARRTLDARSAGGLAASALVEAS